MSDLQQTIVQDDHVRHNTLSQNTSENDTSGYGSVMADPSTKILCKLFAKDSWKWKEINLNVVEQGKFSSAIIPFRS